MRRRLAVTAMLVVTAALAACDEDTGLPLAINPPSGTLPTAAAGVYVLQSAAGDPLPISVEGLQADLVELVSDVFTLAGNGRFMHTFVLRITDHGVVTLEEHNDPGNWRTDGGNNVVFQYDLEGFIQRGTLTNRVLVIDDLGSPRIYAK
jgi:hypothetical protein